jgi:endonuclease/exonuclease/phosphatase family metal-dependent hydrolase
VLEAVISVEGHPIRFLNTHLGLAKADRDAQIRVIAESVRGGKLPVIAVGDWNTRRQDGELSPLEDAGLMFCGEGPLPSFPSHAPDRDLDHILVSKHFKTRAIRVEPVIQSDHLPVVADLQFQV